MTALLDVDGDGFDDGTLIADAGGAFRFPFNLAGGLNPVSVRVVDGFGQSRKADLPVRLNRAPEFTSVPQADFLVPPPGGDPEGDVSPDELEELLPFGESVVRNVSITLPPAGTGSVSAVDVFLLFDDTGSFASTVPTIISLFPTIVSNLQASFPAIDFAFGVGRFEEYGSFASESATGRPFTLNQPIVRSATPGFQTALSAALSRTAPGGGGDGPETMIEALYQVATGIGFDGNNDGDKTDSGPAGRVLTQTSPGNSGDVPPFSTFVADPPQIVLAPSGNLGGVGFRSSALPIILVATDIGTAYQPDGLQTITGAGGVTQPLANFLSSSRGSTPGGRGATIQNTINALNDLGALVIGLGTNTGAAAAPRRTLEAVSRLTGAINNSTTPIDSQVPGDPIVTGDPLYFRITPGSGPAVSVAIGASISSAVTNVFFDIETRLEDPSIPFENLTGVVEDVGPDETASFDVEITGDGGVHSTRLLFVREGSGLILGSIPLVIDIENYTYSPTAVDADGDAIAFALLAGPAGASFDPVLGRLTWDADLPGTYHFEIEATDSFGGRTVQAFDVEVTTGGISLPPTIDSTPVDVAKVGRTYRYDVQASDPDGDHLSYFLTAAPEGMTIDRETGLILWDAAADQVGGHSVTVLVLDGRGEEDTQSFVVVAALPIIPTIALAAGSDTGLFDTDLITMLTQPTLTGIAETGNTVQVFRGPTLIGTAVAMGGIWSLTPSAALALPEGPVTLTATATDSAGNAFTSAPLTIVVDATEPPPPPAPDLDPASDLGFSDTDNLTSQVQPVFNGTADGSLVLLYVDGSFFDAAEVAVDGTWTVALSSPLDAGTFAISVEAVDLAGNFSAPSAELLVTIDPIEPPLSLGLDPAFDSAPLGDGVTTEDVVILRGVTEPLARVALFRGGSQVASTTAAADGAFQFPGVPLAFGPNIMEAVATDEAGNTTLLTQSFGRLATSSLFADEDLEQAVRDELGIPAGQFVTPVDMLGLQHLQADSNLIDSLSGLEFAINLESLSLLPTSYADPGHLSTLEPLAALDQLASLTLQRRPDRRRAGLAGIACGPDRARPALQRDRLAGRTW